MQLRRLHRPHQLHQLLLPLRDRVHLACCDGDEAVNGRGRIPSRSRTGLYYERLQPGKLVAMVYIRQDGEKERWIILLYIAGRVVPHNKDRHLSIMCVLFSVRIPPLCARAQSDDQI